MRGFWQNGQSVVIEVKGDHQIEDRVVQAKADYSLQLADASGMRYRLIRGSEAIAGRGI